MSIKRSKGTGVDIRIILNLLSDPVLIADQNGLLIMVNDAFGKATGLNPEELIGKHFTDLPIIDIKTKALLMEKWAKTMQGAPSEPYEVRFVTPAGEKRIVEMKASRIIYDGEPADLVILRDVTHRKEDAKRLEEYAKRMEALVEEKIKETKESEEKFHAISASAMDAIILMDDTAGIVYWNPAATRIFGYTEEEAIGKNLEKLLFPPQQHGLHSRLAQIFSGKNWQLQGKTIKFTVFRKNGTEIPIELSASTVELKNKLYLLDIIRDVSERKKAEEKLRDSEEKLGRIVDSAPDPIVVSSSDAKVLDCNPAALKTFGYATKSEVIGRNVFEFFAEKERARAAENLAREGEDVRNIECIFQAKNGREFPGELSASPVVQPSGEVACFVSTIKDLTERKKAEEELRSAEHFIYLDNFGRILDVNAKAIEMFGGSKEELLGKHFRKIGIFSIKNIPMLMRSFPKILRGKEVNIELPITNKKQQQIILDCSASLLKTEESTGMIIVARNITERKKAEENIRNAEEMYRQLFNTIPSGVAVYRDIDNGEDFVFVDFNKTAEKIETIPKQNLLGKRVTEVFPGVKDLGLFKVFQRVLRTGRAEYVPTGVYKDERISGWRENWVYKLPNGAIVAVYNDTTERVKTNQKLAKEQEELNLIINSSPVLIFYKDNEGKILRANKAFAEALKMPQEEFVGKTVFDLYSAKIARSMAKDDMEVLQSGHPKLGIIEQYESARGLRWVQTDKVPIFDENDVPNGLIGFAQDITERVKMQKKLEKYSRHLEETVEKRTRELKEANAKLLKAERLAAIGELAGMVGHDLRNPLTGIKNAAYYLTKKGQALDDNSKKMLEIIDSAINRSDKIIGDLQEYSREIQLDLTRCSPRSILQEALAVVQIPAKVKIVDNVPEDPLIRADKTKMVRVFRSIVKNAVDAMPEGGTLQITSAHKDGNVEISFADTGIGIPKEALNKLFSPLVTTKAQGMGFGLAICKRIIEAHQGSITVQSVEGKGSTFTVTIPIEPKLKDTGKPEWINLPKSYRQRRKHKR
jgi:PAS domain S-box-containing protein